MLQEMHTVALLLLLSPHLADGASLARWLDKTCGAGGELSRVGVQCDIMEATFCTGAGSSSVQYSCDANGMTKTEFRDTTSCGEDLPETCAGLPLPCTTQDEVDALVVCVALKSALTIDELPFGAALLSTH